MLAETHLHVVQRLVTVAARPPQFHVWNLDGNRAAVTPLGDDAGQFQVHIMATDMHHERHSRLRRVHIARRHQATTTGTLDVHIHSQHGGAAARPFTTHMNAFDLDLYLRIAPELFLKRCLVGGIDRVFEINRDFRNEGVDATHAPEFTMVEAYQAYGNYDTIGALVKQLVQDTAMDVFGTHKVTLMDGSEYDFGGEWKTISMYDSLSEALGEEIVPNGGPDNPGTSVEHLGAIADKLGVERDDVENHGKLVEHLWEHFYEDKLYEPTFVRDFPVETSPLVKGHRTKPGVVEKWDLYVRGFELATGYSELNDPIVQRERFVAQAKDALAGDEEACDIDEDFLEALGVGMPPAGGMGMGIDRLLIALTGATIRETKIGRAHV